MIVSLVIASLAFVKGFLVPSVPQWRCNLREMSLSSDNNKMISPQSYIIDLDTKLLLLEELAKKYEFSFTKEDFTKIVIPLIYSWMTALSNEILEKEKRIEAEIRNNQEKKKRIEEKDERINKKDIDITKLQYQLNNERSIRYALEQTRILVEMGAISEYPDAKSNTIATNELIRLLFKN